MEQRKYNHVERLDSPEVEGLLNGTITYSPKLDGSNAALQWDSEKNEIAAFSRNRRLTKEKDNAGFYAWATSDDEEAKVLRNFCFMYPDVILYGEWMGTTKFVGNIKDYNQEALNKMWLFDMYSTRDHEYLLDAEWRQSLDIFYSGFDFREKPFPWYVPFYTMEDPTVEKIQEAADNNFFLLDNANHAGEGIVIRRADFLNKYGHYEIGKFVREDYKQNKTQSKKVSIAGNVEKSIIAMFLTDAEMSKAIAKIELATNEQFSKSNHAHVGRFLTTIWHDAILEEMPAICKKFKNPTIDFKALRHESDVKGRTYIGL